MPISTAGYKEGIRQAKSSPPKADNAITDGNTTGPVADREPPNATAGGSWRASAATSASMGRGRCTSKRGAWKIRSSLGRPLAGRRHSCPHHVAAAWPNNCGPQGRRWSSSWATAGAAGQGPGRQRLGGAGGGGAPAGLRAETFRFFCLWRGLVDRAASRGFSRDDSNCTGLPATSTSRRVTTGGSGRNGGRACGRSVVAWLRSLPKPAGVFAPSARICRHGAGPVPQPGDCGARGDRRAGLDRRPGDLQPLHAAAWPASTCRWSGSATRPRPCWAA